MAGKYAVFDAQGVCTSRLIEGVNNIPSSAIAINEALFLQMTQETDGQWRIDAEGVVSKTIDSPNLGVSREQVEALRLRAYAEPLIGSDRYFAQAQRMQAMNKPNWEAVQTAGVARFEANQALYPWDTPADPEHP